MNTIKRFLFNAGFCLLLLAASSKLYAQGSSKLNQPYTIEYYYKVKWGYTDEFLTLFKKNHYPVLKKQIELGRIISVKMESPKFHSTEDGRWDFRVTIVWKNPTVTFDDFDEQALIKQLYPDQATFKKEEERRFEILLSHWDVPITSVALEDK